MKDGRGFHGPASLLVALALCAAAAGCGGGNSNDGGEEEGAEVVVLTEPTYVAAETGVEPGAGADEEAGEEEADELEERVGELARPPGNSNPAAEPYLRGKVVVIGRFSYGRPYLDRRSMGRLGGLAAASPEEVQTVVLKDCSVRRVGFYTNRENLPREFPAFAITCDVSIVDRALGAAVYWKRFESKVNGETTADSTANFVSMYSLLSEIDSFLKRLPRR